MPTEKAHGIQIAKMCEAFVEEGLDLTLVVPTRATVKKTVRDYYGLRVEVPLVRLWTPDFYLRGPIGYRISSYVFMFGYTLFLLSRRLRGERFAAYTVDLDNFSSSALPLCGAPVYSEMHGAKPASPSQRFLFTYARGIIAINRIIVEELKATFPRSRAEYLIEPNGVDARAFAPLEKSEARKRLQLPVSEALALYAGRFFDWKGLEILPQAAALTPDITWHLVGGDEAHFKEFAHEHIPSNVRFVGSRPHGEMRWWLAAADVLVVLGTKRDVQSYRYTSPMKLFEYLLAKRPIVASATPAIREVVSEKEALLYEPDSAEDLARKVTYAVKDAAMTAELVEEASRKGEASSWNARARRIVKMLHA